MRVKNKGAGFFSKSTEKTEAGVVLTGPEVKAVKGGYIDLKDSYIRIIGSEAYLINAKIFPYKFALLEGYDEARTRKLLLHKKEIIALKSKVNQGNMTIIPLSIYTKDHLIKLELGLVRGKKRYEKKRELKERDLKRETREELKLMSQM